MKFKLLAILFLLNICNICRSQTTNYSDYVNPFIGTGGAGHTFPGAVLPFGMVQLSPDTRIDGSWEGCSGYHYSDSVIYGFSHTHLSGTGVSDYGDVLVMPTVGEPSLSNKIYSSKFSHTNEKASTGYYSVMLDDDKVKAELTATTRVGIHRYTFPTTKQANIILDLLHRDKTLSSTIKIIDSVTVTGERISEAWAKEQHVYFVIKFSKPFKTKNISKKQSKTNAEKTTGNDEGAYFQFDLSDGNPLMIKVSVSQTDVSGAVKNMSEAVHWDFEKYKMASEIAWNEELSKIEVTSADKEKLKVFYTALYHCMIHPSVASDVDGRYRGRDMKIHQANGFVPYTVFSLWDTFRALNPLLSIIDPKRTADFVNSFTQQYAEAKRLPVWELSANETDCMIGFHSVSIIADAFLKDIPGIDTSLIYKAITDASNYNGLGIPAFNSNYYLQVNDEPESVSKTLEYAYDNWCISRVALKLKKRDDYLLYTKRAQAYKNVYDPKTGFMRPRKNGNWFSPFEPREVNNHYTEANSWQYTFFVPQDINGLIRLMGGEKGMEKKLDELFSSNPQTVGRDQADITGLIGQYAHGNEPSHHMAYLYNYVGKPYKTQEKTYKILTEFYKNMPDGLIGNEDCGQMSAWYVLSSMGFYQVCPGSPDYTITTPLFDKVKIHTDKTHSFQITKLNPADHMQYIKSCTLNKNKNELSHFSHQQLIQGGELEFTLTDTKDSAGTFGKSTAHRPHTNIPLSNLVIVPVIYTPQAFFQQAVTVTIEPSSVKRIVYYTLDGKTPSRKSKIYTGPFKVDTTLIIKALAYEGKDSSSVTISNLYKKPNNWTIQLASKYNKQYSAGGDEGLIDGQHGTSNWRSGEWQGYQGQDFESVIDMGKIKPVETITSSYLQDTRAWIIFPKKVSYFVSEDGKNYKLLGTSENGIAADDYSIQMRTFISNSPTKINARYIKIKATNYGKLPDWHQGKGGENKSVFGTAVSGREFSSKYRWRNSSR